MSPRGERLALPAERSSPGAARRWLQPMIDGRVADVHAVLLCLSELVANAVLHARTPCEVAVTWPDSALRVEVTDTAPAKVPVMRDYDRTAPTGRGLRLIDSCTQRWGTEIDDRTKTVWFEVALGVPAERP